MKRKRFLPQGVSRYRDRHGKWRYRYRRAGHPGGHFTADFGTPEWQAELAAFEAGTTVRSPNKPAPGSIGALVLRYAAVETRLGPTAVTQGKVRAVLHRFAEQHGHRMVADTRFEHIDAILAKAAVKDTVQTAKGPRPVGGIHAAKKLRKELVRLFDFAIKLRMIVVNPAMQAERVKQAPGERSKGFHSWTEGEIAQYRARHPLGTDARLALELMLWTGQRRSDAQALGPADIQDQRFVLSQGKTGKVLGLRVAQQLLDAIDAMPPLPPGATTYLVSKTGRPWTRPSFGNAMRKWCDAAGLPHCSAHGLRKANMRRMAELGESNATMKAVSGHSKDDEVARYTAAANQQSMADAAIDRVSAWELSNRGGCDSLTASQTPGKEG